MSCTEEEKRGSRNRKNGWVIPSGCEFGREHHEAADGAQQERLAWGHTLWEPAVGSKTGNVTRSNYLDLPALPSFPAREQEERSCCKLQLLDTEKNAGWGNIAPHEAFFPSSLSQTLYFVFWYQKHPFNFLSFSFISMFSYFFVLQHRHRRYSNWAPCSTESRKPYNDPIHQKLC